jgi:cytochrome c oxidase assembly factor CtaG
MRNVWASMLAHGLIPGADGADSGRADPEDFPVAVERLADLVPDLAVLGLLLVIAVLYGMAWRKWRRIGRRQSQRWRLWANAAGLAALALALLGPPAWENAGSFTAHMLQHLLLTLVAPPLLLLGQPGRMILVLFPSAWRRAGLRALLRDPGRRRILAFMVSPLVAGLLINTATVVWHVPALYDAALGHPLVHNLEHGSFFWTAILFWSVVIAPAPLVGRRSTSGVLLLLFATWMVSDLLGATLTLANDVLYAAYAGNTALSPEAALADQRLGGILMWAGGGVFYALCMLGILVGPYVRRGDRIRTIPVGGEDVRAADRSASDACATNTGATSAPASTR